MNLMCPARILLLPGDVQDPAVGERIAQVYAGPFEAAAGARLADLLGVRLTVVPELVRRPDEELQSIADLHRGEAVVVLGLDLGLKLPAIVEHTGDGWTRVPSDNEVTLATYEQAADAYRESIPQGPNATLSELVDLPRHFVMWQEGPLREQLAATGWTVEHFTRDEGRNGGWFQILAIRS